MPDRKSTATWVTKYHSEGAVTAGGSKVKTDVAELGLKTEPSRVVIKGVKVVLETTVTPASSSQPVLSATWAYRRMGVCSNSRMSISQSSGRRFVERAVNVDVGVARSISTSCDNQKKGNAARFLVHWCLDCRISTCQTE